MDVVYRASELGGCTRFLIGKRMGYTEMPPPAKFQGYFDRGNDVEDEKAAYYMNNGYSLTCRQETVELPVTSTVSVVGHIDGLIADDDAFVGTGDHVWECKRVSPAVFKQFVEHGWEANYSLLDRYKWQASCYMVAKNRELWFDVVALIDGEYHTHTLHQELPFYSELQIKTRVLSLEAAAQQGELGDTCDKPNYPCPLYYLPGHDADEVDTDEKDEVVSSLCLAIAESKRDVEAATKRDKDLRRELLTVMGERTRVRTEVATVSVQKSYRTVTDKVRMEADGFKLEDYQTKEEGDSYVRVTPRKGTVVKEVDTDDTDNDTS